MANVLAVHSVGTSIMTYLRNTYPQQVNGINTPSCGFELFSAAQMASPPDEDTRLTLFLYRITVNEHNRQVRPAGMSPQQQAPLGVDLHFLLTAWGGTALDEQVTLTWATRQLHEHPILDASSLAPDAGWQGDEVVQIIPAELQTEDLMRIWDALEPSYRLSVSYIARLVRIDPDVIEDAAMVVAKRMAYGQEVAA